MELILEILLLTSILVYMYFIYKYDLQMMQQNSYRISRYVHWLSTSNSFASVRRASDIVLLALTVTNFPKSFVIPVVVIALWLKIILDIKKKYKKPLVYTKRAVRQLVAGLIVSLIIILLTLIYTYNLYTISRVALLLCVVSYAVTIAANWCIKPVENHINKGFYNDAVRILSQMKNMTVIGITGSYGKTSTKHYLNRILSEKYNVLMTPGSFNTPMGVIRTVREMLKPYHDIFICEMGAKQIGDIKEICDLVHPKMGIITAVGEQHLESFKSIENVQRTKFELIDALPSDGFASLNNDFPFVANRNVSNVRVKRYAIDKSMGTDYYAENIVYSSTGTSFTIVGDGHKIDINTKLVGDCNISNLMGAIIIALKLDVPDTKIQYAISKIEQVEHRLNMKHTPNGITIIDDAFNSNPDGAKMAIDVLARMTQGKRIIITPGMIELGEKQYDYNKRFGMQLAKCCDYAIVVGEYNREAISEGLKDAGFPDNCTFLSPTFKDAQIQLNLLVKSGDTVLYENDLPDTFK